MLFPKTIAVPATNHTKPTDTLCEHNAGFLTHTTKSRWRANTATTVLYSAVSQFVYVLWSDIANSLFLTHQKC